MQGAAALQIRLSVLRKSRYLVWLVTWNVPICLCRILHYAGVCRACVWEQRSGWQRRLSARKTLRLSMQTLRAALEKAIQWFINKTWRRRVILDATEWQLTLIYMAAVFPLIFNQSCKGKEQRNYNESILDINAAGYKHDCKECLSEYTAVVV